MKKQISTSKIIKYASLIWTIIELCILIAIFVVLEATESPHQERWIVSLAVLAFALTVVQGNLLVILYQSLLAKPLKKLTIDVENFTYGNTPKLKRTRVSELNNLMDSIEKLHKCVYNYSSTLSNAIDTFAIGLFFYQENSQEVYCTQAFYDICELDETEGYLRREDFDNIYAYITQNPVPQVHATYYSGDNRMIRISTRVENNFILGIVTDVTKQMQEIQKLEQERDYDYLTKLYVRPAFVKEAAKHFENPEGKIMAVIMWDIDKLKYINDTYGHDCGDRYLCRFAEVIKTLEEHGGIVARRSGDEFLGLIVGDSHSEVIDIINHLRNKINDTAVVIGDNVIEKLRASMGIAWYPDDGESLEMLINYADFALYEVKFNLAGITERSKFDETDYKLHYNKEFQKIVEGDCITFAYQPIVSAKDGTIFGYEFLMRIFSDIITSPRKLITIGKLYSKLHLIEDVTFIRAFEEYENNHIHFQDKKIFINSLANVILTDKTLKTLAKPYGNLEMLVVELMDLDGAEEEVLMNKNEIFRDYRAQIAIDNFDGNLDYLEMTELDVKYLKLDISVIDNINKEIHHQKILQRILQYASSRDIKTIAVGVKNYEDMRYLIEAGVDYLQGNYIGMPSARAIAINEEIVRKIKALNNQ